MVGVLRRARRQARPRVDDHAVAVIGEPKDGCRSRLGGLTFVVAGRVQGVAGTVLTEVLHDEVGNERILEPARDQLLVARCEPHGLTIEPGCDRNL